MIAKRFATDRSRPLEPGLSRLIAPSILAATALLASAWAQAQVQATAQLCVNESAPAPLKLCVSELGHYNVWLNQQGTQVPQFYGTDPYSTDWVLGIGPPGQRQNFSAGYVLPAGQNTSPQVVAFERRGSGSADDPHVVENVLQLPGTGLVLTQQFLYVNGQRTLRKRWVLRNDGAQPVAALNFFHGGDATFGGEDDARSWRDPVTGMVYLTNDTHAQYGYMGTAAHTASPAEHYYAAHYDAGQWIAQGNLPNIADPNYVDAGYYLQWQRDALLPGHSWIIEARETWSEPGILQVISPAATHIKPGETRLLRAKVHNISNSTATTAALHVTDELNWSATPQPASVTLQPGSATEVQILVTAPANAPSGQFNMLSLQAEYGGQTFRGELPLQVLNLQYHAPASINLGAADLGATHTEVLTFQNQGESVTLGSLDATASLGPQFSLQEDDCSGQTLATAASCSVTLVHQPTSHQAFSGTLRWPIIAPVLDQVTTSVTASTGGVMVQTSATAGGSITPASVAAPYLQSAVFTVTPQTGHRIHSVSGCGGTLNGNTYTTAALYQGCTISVEFRPIEYRINTLTIGNGSLSPTQRDIPFGQTGSFSVTPAPNHHLSGITGCGGTLTGSTYTTATISAACMVQANFLPNRYSVSTVRQGGGTVTPTLAQVIHGSSATFTLTPAIGHSIASASGCSGTLDGNEYRVPSVTDHCAVQVQFIPTEPVFAGDLSLPLEIQATGLLTALPDEAFPPAFDHAGQALTARLIPSRTHFPPGRHELQWRAVDARGVTATATQVLHVWPTVSMGADVWAGHHRGDTGAFRIVLNGTAPQYPFTVNYHVDGEHPEHDLRNGQVTFESGETEKEVFFAVTAEPEPGTPQREITVSLTRTPNTGQRSSLRVQLNPDNMPPRVQLHAHRDNQAAGSFDRHGGGITLSATVIDPNSRDSHTYQWTTPANAAVTDRGAELLLQPDSLQPGVHRFRLQVSDDGSPQASTTAVLDLVISDAAPALPAGARGWLANGLPDHPDYAPAVRHALPTRQGDVHLGLLEAEPGMRLTLGALAMQAGQAQSSLPPASSTLPPDSIVNVGGYFDFRSEDLAAPGISTAIVIPQHAAVPANAVYRKFDTHTGQWLTFIEDLHNELASAPGTPGICPAPDSSAYRPGLNAGDWCVRLTIEDGGPNDQDGERNGAIADPGGVGQIAAVNPAPPAPPPPEPQPTRRGGRGSLDWLLLGLATALLGIRTARRLHL